MRKPDAEIRTQLNQAEEVTFGEVPPKFPGNSYEEGVVAALAWVLGDDETAPMEEDL